MKTSAGKAPRREKKREATAAPPARYFESASLKQALLLAAIILVALLAYSNSFHAGFLLDNDPIILKDARIKAATAEHLQRIFREEYWPTGMSGLYRPLTTLSYMLNYSLFGDGANPGGYHWLNFLLHAINIALVYLLGLAIFTEMPAALVLAALWGLHPILTESVTNIVGRADPLGAFGVLAALYAHRKASAVSGLRKIAWLAAIFIAVLVGMFSKESTIVVLAVFVIYDLTFGTAASWKARIPSYAAAIVPCAIFLALRTSVISAEATSAFPFGDNPLMGAGFLAARLTAFKVIGRYILLLIWPAHLSFDYSYNEIPLFGTGGAWEDMQAIVWLLLCAAAAVAAVIFWRRRKPVSFGIAFFFAVLAPTSNLVIRIGSIMAERFLYLPSLGFAVVAVYGLCRLASRAEYRKAVPIAVGAILLALAFRTHSRNEDWVDQGRFWRTAAEAAPGSYKTNLAAANNAAFINQQDTDRALAEVDRALAILDKLPDLQNVGTAWQQAGVFYWNLGIRLESAKSGGHADTGSGVWYRKSLNALLRSERIELAQDEVNRAENAKRGKPGLTFVPSALYLHLGRTYQKLGDSRHALEAFEHGHALESDADLLEELGSAYRAAGETRKAAMALVEALAVDSSRSQLASQLVDLYSRIDPSGCAVTHEGNGASLNVDCPLVHGDICAASRNVASTYERTWQLDHAASIRQTAIRDLGCAPELLK